MGLEPSFAANGDRRVAWSELGEPDGAPVLWCHGGLSSRLDATLAPADARRGVRLITVDRPGIGESDRWRGHTVADWVDDALAVLDAAGVERAGVIGWSAGGPFALAVAARAPERVTRVATMGGMGPARTHAERKQLGLAIDRLLLPLSRRTPWLARGILRAAGGHDRERAKRTTLKMLSDADRRVLAPLPAEVVTAGTGAAAAHGTAGTIDDYRAVGSDWGFELAAVSAPVALFTGDADTAVPPSIVEHLASLLPTASVHRLPDTGHYVMVEHTPDVIAALLPDR